MKLVNVASFLFSVFFLWNVYCDSDEIRTISFIDYYEMKEPMADFFPIRKKDNELYDSSNRTLIVHETANIINFDFTTEYIVYTVGYGDYSIPILYNRLTNTKVMLHDVIKNKGDDVFYNAIREVFFIDNESIMISAINPNNFFYDVFVYNIHTRELNHLFSEKNITIHDVLSNLAILSQKYENEEQFYIYDTLSNKRTTILINDISKLLFINKNTIIAYVVNGMGRIVMITLDDMAQRNIVENKNVIGLLGVFSNRVAVIVDQNETQMIVINKLTY